VDLPEPEVGQVIRYGYLWQYENAAGREESSKIRPCAIVLAVAPKRDDEEGTYVVVAPITHTPPRDTAFAIEIPATVKQRLGLDDERSWIILLEVNRFRWPGPDLWPVRAEAQRREMLYGSLPRTLMQEALRLLAIRIRAGTLNIVKRTE